MITITNIMKIVHIYPGVISPVSIGLIDTGEMTPGYMWTIFMIFVIVIILTYILLYTWFSILFGNAYNIEGILRLRMIQKFLTLSPGFYERNKTGDLMAKATNDMRSVNKAMGFGLITL